MGEESLLDYLYGDDAEQFDFLMVPMPLLKDPIYRTGPNKLNSDARLLYSLMLNRSKLSRKNGWIDEHNRVFIRYSQKEAEQDIDKKKDAVIEAFKKLERVVPGGLIERKEIARGKPYLIYVKNFNLPKGIGENQKENIPKDHMDNIGKTDTKKVIPDVDNIFQDSEKPNTTGRIIRLSRVGKTDTRNNDLKNKYRDKEPSFTHSRHEESDDSDAHISLALDDQTKMNDTNDETDAYISLIARNIGYPEMMDTLGGLDRQVYENMFHVICDVVCSKGNEEGYITIGREQKPYKIVKSVFLKLNYYHLEHAMRSMDRSRKPVTDMKQYLKTVLYNSYLTMDASITQELKSEGVI